MPNFGAIYIAHNPRDGANVYKVGKTERDVDSRMAELNAETTSLGQDSACACCVVLDVDVAERACHERLSRYRVQDNREFFELELRRILALVQEAVQPFVAQSFVPPMPERGTHTPDLNIPLSERLQRQRDSAIKAAETRRSKKEQVRSEEEQAKAELLTRITGWRQELTTKICVVQEAFADLDFIRWEEQWPDQWPEPWGKVWEQMLSKGNTVLIARVILRSTWKGERVRPRSEKTPSPNVARERPRFKSGPLERFSRMFAEWGRNDEPPRPTSLASGRVNSAPQEREELQDGHVVGELLMWMPGREIRVAAFSVDGQRYSIEGAASCSSPDDAIDLLGALIAEYSANPITGARTVSSYKTALLERTAGGSKIRS